MTFFSHRPHISNFPPIFPVSGHFPPVSRKLLSPPYFSKFPSLCFRKIHLLFTYFLCISFTPYFDHDAFMHHLMHVLDAPGVIKEFFSEIVVVLVRKGSYTTLT